MNAAVGVYEVWAYKLRFRPYSKAMGEAVALASMSFENKAIAKSE